MKGTKLEAPVNEIPFPVTITSSVRTQEEQDALYAKNPEKAPKNPPHLKGKAIDIADNEEGLRFWNWLNSSEGRNWINKYKAEVLYHDVGSGAHYHVEFEY
jgi:hypothetical protein